jgi:hypothetical protein
MLSSFQHIRLSTLQTVTLVAIILLVAVYTVLGFEYRDLAPFTILDLEFAARVERLGQMRAAWGEAGTRSAIESLWIDFLFIPCYVAALGTGALWAGRGLWPRASTLVAWGLLAAGVLDGIENTLLLTQLPTPSNTFALSLAALAAGLKFALIAVAIGFILAACGRRVVGAEGR